MGSPGRNMLSVCLHQFSYFSIFYFSSKRQSILRRSSINMFCNYQSISLGSFRDNYSIKTWKSISYLFTSIKSRINLMSCCNLLLLFLLYCNISFCFLTFYFFYREKKGQEEHFFYHKCGHCGVGCVLLGWSVFSPRQYRHSIALTTSTERGKTCLYWI